MSNHTYTKKIGGDSIALFSKSSGKPLWQFGDSTEDIESQTCQSSVIFENNGKMVLIDIYNICIYDFFSTLLNCGGIEFEIMKCFYFFSRIHL